MVIEQTVDIPASRRLTIDVPHEVPAGRVVLTFTPADGGAVEARAKAADDLEKAAAMMAAEYAADPELTAFCALDGEDFYEAR
ncbi:MAG: hypothetical protein LBD20_01450 [Spirochaetaceae bacterium]|jgi:hypothetical protein|nr:hypothetical protein [Spirochaetaceae bacterium]